MKTPVMLVTGYLGAGKTTLLRRVISNSRGKKIAVLMNEFGRIGIDGRVLEGRNVRITELTGGCVCCSMSGELAAAIEELVSISRPETIVVETTGLAEPSTIARDIAENMPLVRLDAVVTVVDANSLARSPSIGHTGMEQIGLADIIILNKTDLVQKESLESIETGLMRINTSAKIIKAQDCVIDTDVLFGQNRTRGVPGPDEDVENPNAHGSFSRYFDFVCECALDHDGFIKLLDALPNDMIRAKGFVKTTDGNFLMNHVSGRHTMEPYECGKTELVFLGEGIEKHEKAVRQALERLKRAP